MRNAASIGATVIVAFVAFVAPAPAQQPDFHAIVKPDGVAVLCLRSGEILFADRCEGSGRLSIVQPFAEGPLSWRTVPIGTVRLENEMPNPDCALSRAKWDDKTARVVPSGKQIRKVEAAAVLPLIDRMLPGNFIAADIAAFALDLDNDGKDEIIYVASNLPRAMALHEKAGDAQPFYIQAGIVSGSASFPSPFYADFGEYLGGTDTIGDVELKGVVQIAAGTGEVVLLVKAGTIFTSPNQLLIRYARGQMQRIDVLDWACG